MFRIETKSIRLDLEIVRVDSLLLHEETLPELGESLLSEFNQCACLRNPIIIDRNHIVLDGNHRAFAFQQLKFRYMPVCKIDYFSRHSRLRYWFRLLGNVGDRELLEKIIAARGGNFQPVADKEALRRTMEDNLFSCGIQQGGFYALLSFPEDKLKDAVSAYAVLQEIQDQLVREGVDLEYIPCQSVDDSDFCRDLEDDKVIIWTPLITKKMVIDAAKEAQTFAPKSTRHLIPARPLHVDVPTDWCREDVPLQEINRRFYDFLNKKRLKRFAPGQVIDGRYYEEELFVFFAN